MWTTDCAENRLTEYHKKTLFRVLRKIARFFPYSDAWYGMHCGRPRQESAGVS